MSRQVPALSGLVNGNRHGFCRFRLRCLLRLAVLAWVFVLIVGIVRAERLGDDARASSVATLEQAEPAPAPGDAPENPVGGDARVTAEMDLSGVACPMNFVKAKLRLETMEVGATLAVLLDDGDPVERTRQLP